MRQHQCLVTRELDRDLAITHAHPYSSAPILDRTNLLVFDLDQTHRGTPRVRGYHTYAEDGRRVDTTLFNSTVADASNAFVTTPHDVNRFFTALIGGHLLGPEELTEMLRTRPMPGEPERLRPGPGADPLSCGGFYWYHGGNALGYASENGITADGRRAVTVSTNSFDAAVRSLVDRALCDGR